MSSAPYRINHADDAQWAALQIRRFATQHGASQTCAWELATALSELVNNVVKYAGVGEFSFVLQDSPRRAICVTVCDRGPGIADPAFALEDAVSQGQRMQRPGVDILKNGRRSLGHGLGAVRRLVDELQVQNRRSGGLKVLACKYLRA